MKIGTNLKDIKVFGKKLLSIVEEWICGWKDNVPTWYAFDQRVEMDDILNKDIEFGDILTFEQVHTKMIWNKVVKLGVIECIKVKFVKLLL